MKRKIVLSLIFTMTIISLLPILSLATNNNIQMLKKEEHKYILYISNLLEEKFEFAFSNKEDENKEDLVFRESALDKVENGNNIAYIDSEIYTTYFENKEETFMWVLQNEEYKIEAQKINLEKALSEQEIRSLNEITLIIPVTVGEKELPEENENGVKITRKIGTLIINSDENATYSYQMFKVNNKTDEKELINLANTINNIEKTDSNIFEKLLIYNNFKELYTKLKPSEQDSNWVDIEEGNIIEQPLNSKAGDQYIVWIKSETENDAFIDVQIMTCKDEYTPEYETQERTIKETSKLPITGDSIVLFVIAGALIILILIVVVFKVKNRNIENKT